MIGFLIKKTFFDIWDNLFKVALINLGFIISFAIPVFIPPLLKSSPILSFITLIIGILWCFIYLSATAFSLKTVSDYGSFGFIDFFKNFPLALPSGLVTGGLVCVLFLLVTIVIPFYLSMSSIFGLLLAAVIFWTIVIGILALQFFLPIRTRLDTSIPKVFKKCFLIFFDNPFFCLFSFVYCFITLIISAFLALLFPGPAGLLLYLDEALRLRLLKYDFLEKNPDADRKKIPWDALLIEDREKTGTRTLRNFIFPWKD